MRQVVMRTIRRHPGKLMKRTLRRMREFVSDRLGQQRGRGKLGPVCTTYLTCVLMPAAAGKLGLRNEGELRTLAAAADALLQGENARVGDLLLQRFKAVEASIGEGGWNASRHLEGLPDARVSARTPEETEEMRRAAERDKRTMKQQSGGAQGRTPRE